MRSRLALLIGERKKLIVALAACSIGSGFAEAGMLALALGRLRYIADPDIAVCLAGLLATLCVLPIEGFSGGLTASTVLGPYYWFAAGVAAYWFCGPGRTRFSRRSPPNPATGVGGPQHVPV
jgi:hypothetical protein